MTRRIVTAQAATAVAILLTSCAAPGIATLVNVEASGSEYFRIEKPTVFARAEGAEITGVVCRRNRTTLLTPDVRIEHLDAAGGVIEVTKGNVPTISVKQDQPCSRYDTQTNWRVSDEMHIRVCIDHNLPCAEPMRPATHSFRQTPQSDSGHPRLQSAALMTSA